MPDLNIYSNPETALRLHRTLNVYRKKHSKEEMGEPSAAVITGSTVAETATNGGDPRIPDRFLVGFGGREHLVDCAPLVENGDMSIFDFVRDVRKKHTVRSKHCEPMMALLKMGGMDRARVEREVLTVLLDVFKGKIPDLDQSQLSELLDQSYTYLTVPELRAIPIAVLERLDDVDQSTWQEIVENGLEEAPYIDLPLTIKRRIWLSIPHAFLYEVDCILADVVEHREPQKVEDFVLPPDRVTARSENSVLQRFLKLLGNTDVLYVQFVDKMVEAAASEESPSKRLGIANIFHDIFASCTPRAMPNVEKLRVMARHLDAGGFERDITLGELREIRDALSESASCGPVALLVSSVYTRELVSDQLIMRLFRHKRMPPKDVDVATEFIAFGGELQRDQFLENLTYICLSNVNTKRILNLNKPLEISLTGQYYSEFYPRVCYEMERDETLLMDNFFHCNSGYVQARLVDYAKKGSFERRILTGYGLHLLYRNNLVGLSKLRLLLDYCFSEAEPAEESRHCAIAAGLVNVVTES